jgi:monofunctional biosynthetic peptidoglycan transglycosylase
MRRVVAAAALVLAAGAAAGGGKMIVDFSAGATGWPSIDDSVMGGVSQSSMKVISGVGVFSGMVSFDNNGGFASVRSRPERRDLSAYSGLLLRVRGDGKRYGFRLRTDDAFDGVSYQAVLHPLAGEWTEVALKFADFEPVYRGRRVARHPALDPSRITTMGLIISRQEGPFRLEIESILGLTEPRS